MESAGNDDGGLARRHVLRTPFSTSLECSKITFALNSARKQTTAIFARAGSRALAASPDSCCLFQRARTSSPPFCRLHPSAFAQRRGTIDSHSFLFREIVYLLFFEGRESRSLLFGRGRERSYGNLRKTYCAIVTDSTYTCDNSAARNSRVSP